MSRALALLMLTVFVIFSLVVPDWKWIDTFGSAVTGVLGLYVIYRHLRGDRLEWVTADDREDQ